MVILRVIGFLQLMMLSQHSVSEDQEFLKGSNSFDKDNNGCLLDGKVYKVGGRAAMNRNEIKEWQEKGGYVADYEVILMQCQYKVDPSMNDHPVVSNRQYFWVSFSWSNS